MQIGNKFRCYPTPAQEQILLQWIGRQRHVYNAMVREDPYFRTMARKSLQHAGRWHVAFNYDDNTPEPSDKDTTDWFIQFDEATLRTLTVGLDRGVALPLAGSNGQQFGFLQVQDKRLLKQERHKKRWQRRQARRTQGSAGWVKAKHKVARYQRYKLYVFEALKVKSMTAKTRPKQDEQGRWIRNGAAAKSGLNKSILASTWGQTKVYVQYKARRQGKLTIEVPPFYSSQECVACGHVHQDNRVSQAEFVCLSCGNTDHADHNAAKVIAMRGVRQLLAGKYVQKEKKRCRITRIQVGAEGSEPAVVKRPTLGETVVSRGGGNSISALWSLTQETPATTLQGV